MGVEEITGMVIEGIPTVSDIVPNANLSLTDLPPEIIAKIGSLITILKAAGIIFIIYMAFLIIRWILNFRRYKHMKQVRVKVDEIDKKLDLLLAEKYHKSSISNVSKGLKKKVIKKKVVRPKKTKKK